MNGRWNFSLGLEAHTLILSFSLYFSRSDISISLCLQKVDPQMAEAIDRFLIKLRACASGDSSFTFILDDPAGNSFIENP